jgi:hypothetical protein
MTVYVDNARIPARVGGFEGRWSHLTADTKDELFVFAAKLGLAPLWLQDKGDGRWHFDVVDTVRERAIRLGAKPIDIREMGEFVRLRRNREAAQAYSDSPRMRVNRGRVMHRVTAWGDGGYQSVCREPGTTVPRARGLADHWTAYRGVYPDCKRCP